MLTYRTAGESHGKAVVAIVEGLPAGMKADLKLVDGELKRRQGGHGRGARMSLEADRVKVLAGLRRGVTLGSPVVLVVSNRDFRLDDFRRCPPLYQPRPGHGDLAGGLKYLTADMRGILERASARETAARVAAGAFVRPLLGAVGIGVLAHVVSIGGVECRRRPAPASWRRARDRSPVYALDARAGEAMMAAIDVARRAGDTLGGVIEVVASGVPVGLGSHVAADRRLDARLASALMSIQAIKGVEVGLGFAAALLPGSTVHDEILFNASKRGGPDLGFSRRTNNAGGIEAGISNGQPIVVRAAMKPIATLGAPLASIDLRTKRAARAAEERSDVCAVPAASVVAENAVAFELARALLEKTGGDTMAEVEANLANYLRLASLI